VIADGAAGLGAVALFAAAGWGISALSPALRRLPLPRRLGYAYLLGLAAVAGSLYALSHWAGVPLGGPAAWAAAAIPALLGPAVALLHPSRRSRPIQKSRRRDLWVRGVAAVLALVALGLAADAAVDPLRDWDGRMTWSAQARYLRAERTVDAEVLRHKRWFITHPQYPLLLPVAQVAALDAFGQGEDSHAFRMLYVGAFAAWLLVAYDGARRLAGRRPAALAVLLAALAPLVQYGEGGAFSAYSDLPLAAFYGAALVLLLAAPPRPSTLVSKLVADGWVAGLLLGAAVLTKNEGLPLAVLLLALAIVRALVPGRPGPLRPRARALLAPALAAALALAALALLASWRSGVPNRQDEQYAASFRLAELWPAIVSQAPRIVPVVLGRMLDWRRWSGFWLVVPALLAAGWSAVFQRCRLPLWAAALAPPAIGWVAYAVAIDPVRLAEVTWERLLLQGSVPLLMLLALALSDILRRLPPLPRPRSRPLPRLRREDRREEIGTGGVAL
jgi:hypothetical protein